MRQKIILAMMLIFFCEIKLFSQNDLLGKIIEIPDFTGSKKEFLKTLATISGIEFSYTNEITLDKKINIKKQKQSISDFLDMVFPEKKVMYQVEGNKILLIPKKIADIPKKYSLNGYVKDAGNGEVLICATIYVNELKVGIISNGYGFYSITLPEGNYTISYSYVGYKQINKEIQLEKDITENIHLLSSQKELEPVIVNDTHTKDNLNKTTMGYVKLNSKTVKNIPALFGEVDVLKTVQLLPGVQTVKEGMSGFSVRGGGSDQNLFILDDATIYYVSHLLGLFSIFNNDAIKDIKFYKGDFPAEYGGRLSSLLDIRMKDGNNKKFEVNGGIGLIASRLSIEGPIVKGKSSFIISGRRTYLDLILKSFGAKLIDKLNFSDLNAKINYLINGKNQLYLSAYNGKDAFGINPSIFFYWGNQTLTLRWNHLFSNKLFSNTSLVYSKYIFNSQIKEFLKFKQTLNDYNFKNEFIYYYNPRNTIKFGFTSTFHQIDPGKLKLDTNNLSFQNYQALEHAIFISNEQKIDSLFTINYGLRYSILQNIGPAMVYDLNDNYETIDSAMYKKNTFYHFYSGLEPRLSIKYSINDKSSIKACYARSRQYLNLVSFTRESLPTDVWVLSNKNIKPRIADFFSIGYFRNFKKNTIEASAEIYYKIISHDIDFKEDTILVNTNFYDNEFRFGKSRTYGFEFMLRKSEGKLNGWICYAYSRAFKKINGINDGREFPANYDKPHNISIVLNYAISKQVYFSANWVYSTGASITFPTGKYEYMGSVMPSFSEKNAYRMPDYHRLDIGFVIKGKEKHNKISHYDWGLSIYNLYNRKNSNAQTYEMNNNTIVVSKNYFFSIIPSFSYNFHF